MLRTKVRRLLTAQIIFVLLIFALMAGMCRRIAGDLLKNNLRKETNEVFNRVSLEIESEFFEPQTALIAISENIRNMIINGSEPGKIQEIINKLADELLLKPDGFTFISIFCYFEIYGGVYMVTPEWEIPEGYDPESRLWYKTAVEAGDRAAYSPVYINMRTNDYTISFVRRLFDDEGNPLAIISLSMPLDRIRNNIADMRITEGGYGILHNGNMEVLYHPDSGLIGKKPEEIGGSLSGYADKIIAGMELQEYETRNYKNEICVVSSKTLNNGWILYMVTPKAEYYKTLRTIEIALFGLGAFCSAVLCAFLISFDGIRRRTEEKHRLKEIQLNAIQKAHDEEERIRLMLDAAPLGVTFRDKNYNTIYCNEEAARMFGLSSKHEFIERFSELSPEYQPQGHKSSEMERKLHDTAIEKGTIFFEWLHQKPDGEQIPCEIIGVSVEFKGEPCVLTYIRDMRELNAAIKEKEETEERMNLIINAMPLACNLWTEDYQNILTNDEAVKLFGLSSKEEYIERFYDLSPEYQPAEFHQSGRLSKDLIKEYLARAFYLGHQRLEWMHQKLNGEPLPTEITLVRIKYKGGRAVVGYSRDLREHKQMMNSIIRRDRLLNMVNKEALILLSRENEDNMKEAILAGMELLGKTIDADHVQIWQNQTVCGVLHAAHLFQWESEEGRKNGSVSLGQSFPISVLPGSKKEFSLEPNINGSVSAFAPEDQNFFTPYNIKSVLIIPLLINEKLWGSFVLDDCRNERSFSEGEIDILRSAGLLIANAFIRSEMTRNIKSGAKKLEEALEETREANNAKSKFLAAISHEIRTPMNVIMGSTESLLEIDLNRLAEAKNPAECARNHKEIKETLEKIYGSGDLLLQIINDILDLSKIEADKFEINPIKYDVTSLISDAANLNLIKYGHKEIAFKLVIDENLPMFLTGDELRVKQVINNLLSNAFKYTEEGEVTLSFLFEKNAPQKDALVIRVTDTGQGMTPEQLNLLYDEYTRFNFEANRATTGTGLGMAITRNLIRLMDGSIEAESEPGKGSVFTARIPQTVTDSRVLGKEAADRLMDFRFNNLQKKKEKIVREPMPYGKVLIVDDMKSNLDVAALLLKPYQLQIETAESGFEALEIIKSGKEFDIIFMDHMMPKMDGIETVKRIREWEKERFLAPDPAHPVSIVALTANAIVGQAEIFKENGFNGCITKPIDTRELNAVLNEYVRNKNR